MAKIKQIGTGRKTSGTIDGVNYYQRNGETYARATPIMPRRMYETPAAKLNQAIWKMIQWHIKKHHRTLIYTVTPGKSGNVGNAYFSANSIGLRAALAELAPRYVAGEDITIIEVEAAISAYATDHPASIKIGLKEGFETVYLTGEWPSRIEMHALKGDGTIIVITDANGVTTTIDANGHVTVSDSPDSNSGGSGSGSDESGSGSGSGESGNGSGSGESGNGSGGDGDGDMG